MLEALFSATQANGDGTIPKTANNEVSLSKYDDFLNSSYQTKSQKRKQASFNTSQDHKVIIKLSRSKQPIASSFKQSATTPSQDTSITTGKTLSQLKNELALQQNASSKLDQAITLLYSNYENQLDLDSFVNAMNLVSSERNASMFFIMKLRDKRDCWLELKLELDTKLEPLDTIE